MTRVLCGTRIRIALATLIAIGGAAGVMLPSGGASADGQKARVTSTDRWRPLAPSPLQRTEVGAARIGRFIYVLGGFVPTPSGATTSEVTRYDIDANEWTKVRSMPVGVNHPAVAAYKGSLYVHGGYTGVVTQPIDRLFRYTPATDTWVKLKNSGRPRAAHALVPIGGKLYAPGGADGQRAFRFLQLYDRPATVGAPAPQCRRARAHRGCGGGRQAVRDRRAGQRTQSRPRRALRPRYAPLEEAAARPGAAQRLPSRGRRRPHRRRRRRAADTEGDSTIGEVEILNPKTGRWRRLPSMLTPRHGLGVVSRGRRVFAIEGGPMPGLPSRALLSSSISAGDGLASSPRRTEAPQGCSAE
jgi:hypothetical protein